ncbi:TetR/AcrR family transcriptional regulator [Aeromicrobium sp.]|uniref:TetR/AcrR family transcriptional regulator n=1 Tax=Aeromicrobium sp. TaxID=1871063 RepID=UPI0028A71BCE|nr:TetR/AcrR family transcriptional regulator [Aeromicrobium sp.]
MSEERSTRDRLLDAFELIIVGAGSRAATLDAVAAEAGVSKGGLLYHFHSKEALVDAMIERLRRQADEDVERMREAPEGPVDFYLETSVDSGSDFDRALIAGARIAQDQDPGARAAMADIRAAWFGALNDHLGDAALARTIMLIGEGLYFHDSAGIGDAASMDQVREVLSRLL